MLNKVAVGTVKFGMAYGVGKDVHQVANRETLELIDHCRLRGVDMFDTAPAYGTAEAILGDQHCAQWAKIVTKAEKIASDTIDQSVIGELKNGFDRSLARLGASQVYGLLVHSVDDLAKPGAEEMVLWMQSLQQEGRVSRIGVSVYDPVEVTKYYQEYDFDLIQLPLNLFDQRFLADNMLQALSNQGVEIHSRSLFLKGLLLNSAPPAGVALELARHHQNFVQELKHRNIHAFDVCMAFARNVEWVDKWVMGFSRLNQLKHVLNWDSRISDQFETTSAGLLWAGQDWRLNSPSVDPRNWSGA